MSRPAPWLAERAAMRSRQARATTCRHCGADILAGLNDDHGAVPVTVDATPVDLITAVAAYLARTTTARDGTTVHAVIHGDLHRLDALQVTSCHRNGLPLHLVHACPSQPEETLL